MTKPYNCVCNSMFQNGEETYRNNIVCMCFDVDVAMLMKKKYKNRFFDMSFGVYATKHHCHFFFFLFLFLLASGVLIFFTTIKR
jgi:hypothetical protein